ncbi:protein FAR1-RELATED SEQUENCE 7-like protein [Carex littledalei]|uniref:Protein FAR1-RELATED SEQUENCE 7-like protein n=1 Tax=Carex littledalei TaxID=544730 RepID=A0A833W172_9POAL|nr:protein FAR1-RELATED SEQUENCE 7-like protein [Carex littledalei]
MGYALTMTGGAGDPEPGRCRRTDGKKYCDQKNQGGEGYVTHKFSNANADKDLFSLLECFTSIAQEIKWKDVLNLNSWVVRDYYRLVSSVNSLEPQIQRLSDEQNDLVHGWGLDFTLRKCVEMDGDDSYIGFEEFLALEYAINSEGDDLLAIEEDLGVGEGQGEEGEEYNEPKNEQSGRKSEEDEAAISDTVQPYVGREFMSADEAYNFYHAYAGHVGFSIRKNTRTKSRNGLSSVRLVCSKEG